MDLNIDKVWTVESLREGLQKSMECTPERVREFEAGHPISFERVVKRLNNKIEAENTMMKGGESK